MKLNDNKRVFEKKTCKSKKKKKFLFHVLKANIYKEEKH